jgi:hypothetical protein
MRYITETFRSRYDGQEIERRVCVITCCGAEIECRNFTNTCDQCGADYNFSGQRLAPRSQWGEETGESWQDCY